MSPLTTHAAAAAVAAAAAAAAAGGATDSTAYLAWLAESKSRSPKSPQLNARLPFSLVQLAASAVSTDCAAPPVAESSASPRLSSTAQPGGGRYDGAAFVG